MKQAAAQKESTTKSTSQNNHANENGSAVSPPAYGIDMVDKVLSKQQKQDVTDSEGGGGETAVSPQSELSVNEPDDAFEQEAEKVADAVSKNAAPAAPSTAGDNGKNGPLPIQRKESQSSSTGRPPHVSPSNNRYIRNPGVGSAISQPVRAQIEPHVGASLGHVRVHNSTNAQRTASQLQARAFTHRHHIFLGKGESANNLRLMAHESTHVVQQGGAVALNPQSFTRTSPQVQRLPSFITDYVATHASKIPGYDLFTYIIQYDPIRRRTVNRTTQGFIKSLFGLLPVIGPMIYQKLNELQIIKSASHWIEGELDHLNLSIDRIERVFQAAWEDIRIAYGFDYNIVVLKRYFGPLLRDVTQFAKSLVGQIIQLIKEKAIDIAEDVLEQNKAWALLKKILKFDPLRGTTVKAETAEILADFLLLIGKEQELAQMQKQGTLEKTAVWLDTQLGILKQLKGEFFALFTSAWAAIQPENLANLNNNLQSLGQQAMQFLGNVWRFAGTVAVKVLALIKDALLNQLKAYATQLIGYPLLTIIVGKDIFTNEPVPRTPENLIGGFVKLILGEDQFQQLQESGVIPQAAERVSALIETLGISWPFVKKLFTDLWLSFTIEDLLQPVQAFERIMKQFGEPISRLFRFVTGVIKVIIELILQVMNFPADIITNILNNATAAFEDIKRDPIGFLKNMLNALKLGFAGFFERIFEHLLAGVTDWLFRQIEAAGITPPTELTLESVLDVVFQILGVTTETLWQKLADRVGQEKVDKIRGAIDTLTGIWTFIRDVQERGIAAIWEYLQEQLSNLWDIVMQKVQDWIVVKIINEVSKKLLGFLDPTGITAVINSFQAIFRAIESAVAYIRDMLRIVDDYISTVASIAKGDVAPGAIKFEQGLANSLPVAIGFLANQVGLGNLSTKLAEIIGVIRLSIDKAFDWLLDKVLKAGQSILNMLGISEEGKNFEESTTKLNNTKFVEEFEVGDDKEKHHLFIKLEANKPILKVASKEQSFRSFIENIDGEEATKKEALAIADRLDILLNRNTSSSKVKEINTELDAIVEIIAPMMSKYSRKYSSFPYWGPVTSENLGTKMIVEFLTRTPPKAGLKGSEPTTAAHEVYDTLKIRRKGNGSFYVKGHLLNGLMWSSNFSIEKHLGMGGPGKYYNLTPLTQDANKEHLSRIEDPIFQDIHTSKKIKAYRYIVEAKYGRGINHKMLGEIEEEYKEDNINRENLERLVKKEKFVPKQINVSAIELDPASRKPKGEKYGPFSIKNNVPKTLDGLEFDEI